MGERVFLLLAPLALAPRWIFKIQSPWLLLVEAPVLVLLVAITIRKAVETRRASGS